MRKYLVLLLAAALLLAGAAAPAEEAVTLEVANEARLPVYAADDPFLEGLVSAGTGEEALPVLVISVRKSLQIQTAVRPQSVKNKRAALTAEDAEILRVQGNSVTGLKPGETVLTIASEQDPTVCVRYRVAVIQPVNHILLKAAEKSVAVGQTIALTAQISPEDATRKALTWSSGDERIAKVDAEGNVTGVARGTARIIATAADGSAIRANISVPVVQNAEEIQLDRTEVTVDVNRNTVLKATVLPKETNDRSVVWTSSDEGVAKVNAQGRVQGVSLGECEIICTSKTSGEVQARAKVRVQQPVTRVTFGEALMVYAGETGKLTWTTEPANASNPEIILSSANPKILTVDADGTVHGLSFGETYVNAVTADGSNRRARVRVKVAEHVQSVQMKRNVAYIDLNTTSVAGAVLTPKNAGNKNMTWESADPSVAKVEPLKKQPWRVNITGVSEGQTVITGTTEDGGLQTSLKVNVGRYEDALELVKDHTYVDGAGKVYIRVRNRSGLNITSVTATVTVTDVDGKGVPCNSKDGSSTFKMVFNRTIGPGGTTKDGTWKYVNYKEPTSPAVAQYEVRITEFQIDNDWVKTIRQRKQPSKKCPVHL